MTTVSTIAPVPAPPPARDLGPNRIGARAAGLERLSNAELEVVFLRAATPDVTKLVGWEFRGTNTPPWMRLIRNKKFVKGMFRDERGDVYGYNCPCAQNRLDEPWLTKPDDRSPRRFGFYRVDAVDPTARDNTYLHALLLDYGKGGNKAVDPTAGLRDYLVQVDPTDDDLYLGKAYYAVGPARVFTNFFVLERLRPGVATLRR
jgi:hypothetical protein